MSMATTATNCHDVARARNKSKSSDVPPQTVFSLYAYTVHEYTCILYAQSRRRYRIYIFIWFSSRTVFLYRIARCRHRLRSACYIPTLLCYCFFFFFCFHHLIFLAPRRPFSRDLMICTISLLGPLRSDAPRDPPIRL